MEVGWGCVRTCHRLHSPPFGNARNASRDLWLPHCLYSECTEYRDRDTDSSYPLAESRDEIGQRLLLNRTKLKQNTGGNKSGLSFLTGRATGDVKNHPRAERSCLRLPDFAESTRDLLSVVVASDPLRAPQGQSRSPGPAGFPPIPHAWRSSTAPGLGRSSEKIPTLSSFLAVFLGMCPAPPSLPPFTF